MINNNTRAVLDLDVLNDTLLTRHFGKAPGWTNELWETIDSTNNRAAELAFQGAPEGIIVAARQQTAGRGRQGRVWMSPPDAGIYASFVIRPKTKPSTLPIYTIATGVACAEALKESLGIVIGLKWVNDLIYDERKIGGILAEIPSNTLSSPAQIIEASGSIALIIGIGMNVSLDETQIPEELVNRINWLEKISGQPVNQNLILANIAKHLELVCDQITANQSSNIIANWKKYSITLGKHIKATTGSSSYEGQAVDINNDGSLVLKTPNNELITLHAGEITIRSADGTYV